MKQKTVQTAAKRFRRTARGKLLRDNAGTSHLFRHKSDRPTQIGHLSTADRKKILKLLALA